MEKKGIPGRDAYDLAHLGQILSRRCQLSHRNCRGGTGLHHGSDDRRSPQAQCDHPPLHCRCRRIHLLRFPGTQGYGPDGQRREDRNDHDRWPPQGLGSGLQGNLHVRRRHARLPLERIGQHLLPYRRYHAKHSKPATAAFWSTTKACCSF
jgi:hypothetical protein